MPTRSPLVLSTLDLGRRAGAMRTHDLDVPAPDAFGIEVLRVPEGDPMRVEVRLESVMDGVLATGEVRARATGECGRCLEPISQDVDATFQELFVYEGAYPEQQGEDEEAADVSAMDGDLIDLEQIVRDAVVMSLPFQPLCRPDCPGLCQTCGIRLADAPAEHGHDDIDIRWAGLMDAFGKDDAEKPGEHQRTT